MNEVERSTIIRYTGFLARRERAKWKLGNERFLIKDLPDSTIERVIGEGDAKQIMQSLRRWPDWCRRQPVYIMLQEAEYRGIAFKWWDEDDVIKEQHKMLGPCIESRHTLQGDTCINCRKSVARSDVLKQMPRKVRLL